MSERNPHVMSTTNTDVYDVSLALDVLKLLWGEPIGAYAHTGEMIAAQWTFDNVISPETYWDFAEKWMGIVYKLLGVVSA